jgi:hypothetical protein
MPARARRFPKHEGQARKKCEVTVADAEDRARDWSALYARQPDCDGLTLESFRMALYQHPLESCDRRCE